jgi:hydrogenase 3 maturation protease
MLPHSWTDTLKQTLTRLQHSKEGQLRVAVAGIGHELRGDDAAGLEVARRLRSFAHSNLFIIEAGHAPENHTGLLRRFSPDLILLVDTAQLNEAPGTIRWLPWQETSGISASTHTMPPYMLARFLTAELNCEIALIGIQPDHTFLHSSLSPVVEEAAGHIAQTMLAILMPE